MRRRLPHLVFGGLAAVMFVGILAIGAGGGPVGGSTDVPGAGLTRASEVLRDRANVALAPIKIAKHRPLLLLAIITACVALALGALAPWTHEDRAPSLRLQLARRVAEPRAPPGPRR